jgi:hypothetical protein
MFPLNTKISSRFEKKNLVFMDLPKKLRTCNERDLHSTRYKWQRHGPQGGRKQRVISSHGETSAGGALRWRASWSTSEGM